MLLLSIMEPQVHLNCRTCEERIQKKREKERKERKKKAPLVRWLCDRCGQLFQKKAQWSLHCANEHKSATRTSKRLTTRDGASNEGQRLPSKELEQILGDLMEISEEELMKEIGEEDVKKMGSLDLEEIRNILR